MKQTPKCRAVPGQSMRWFLYVSLVSLVVGFLTGCQSFDTVLPSASSGPVGLRGSVHGGQQPIAGASIQLYAVGTNGPGSAATPLFHPAITTNQIGEFTFPAYTCPSANTQVYVLATGGDSNPGTGGITSNNAIAESAFLGSCGSLTPSTFISINEVTTIGSIWPIERYIASPTQVGWMPGDVDFSNGVAAITEMVNIGEGVSPGVSNSTGYFSEPTKLYSLANLIASCINSNGGISGDGSSCGNLFAAATPPGGTPPTDTITAAALIAQNPTNNVTLLFNSIPARSPFQPMLSAAPADWTLQVTNPVLPPVISLPSGTYLGTQQVSITPNTSGSAIFYTTDGTTPMASSNVYSSPISIKSSAEIQAIAVAGAYQSVPAASSLTIDPAAATLAFVIQPSSTVINSAVFPGIQVAIQNSSGAVVSNALNLVTLALSNGSGISGTLSAVPVNGIATFSNVTLATVGTYRLAATSPNLGSVTSQPFNVSSPIAMSTETAVPADALVNSVGINVHLSYTDTAYVDFSNVESALQTLGVRHVRDGLIDTTWQGYFQEHNQLGQLGINSIFITSVGESASLFSSYPTLMSQCFEGYENPNEYDNQGIFNWSPPLMAEVELLSNTTRSASSHFPVLAPSLVQASSFTTLGNVSQYVDYGNLHNYPGGHNPGTLGWGGADAEGNAYGGLAWNLDLAAIDTPGLQIMTTETGYTNDLTVQNSVPQSVSAVYMPRVILEQWRAHIARTYLYELVSEGGQDFGLFTSNWTAKPAFHALSNMLNLLTDQGAAFNPGSLAYGIQGGDANLHHLLMQKRNGTFYLALWLEESSYNINTATITPVTPESITLQLPEGSQTVSDSWDNTGTMTTSTVPAGNPLNLTITDKLTILQIVP